MDLFQPCTCPENGTWTNGVRSRGRNKFACIDCNGSVEPRFADGVQLITKDDPADHCSCGIPWLSNESSSCERCGLLVPAARQERLRKVESLLDDDQPTNETETPDAVKANEADESDWVDLVWFALLLLAGFGFFYNISQEAASEEFMIQVINVALLGYTNFLAYPLLLFVVIGSMKRFGLVSRDLRETTLYLFFISPFGVVAFQLVMRILDRLW